MCEYWQAFFNQFLFWCTYAHFCWISSLQEAETGFVPSVQDFDKKLSEADAYLQILIDQLKVCIRAAWCWKKSDDFF